MNTTMRYFIVFLNIMLSITSIAMNTPSESYEMHWNCPSYKFSAAYFENQTSIAITFYHSIAKELPQELHQLFTCITKEDQQIFQFMYGKNFETHDFPKTSEHDNESQSLNFNTTYYLHEPLIHHNENIQHITLDQLINMLQTKSCIIYTGAGISAPVIPTMNILEESLGLTEKTELKWINQMLINPENTAHIMHNFFEACLHGNPTIAHKAIAAYLSSNPCTLITENLDLLHEHSGVTALRFNDMEITKTMITREKLQATDLIFCIGLSHDDRGFLGLYKHHNPHGLIIALSLTCPNFIGNNDYFLSGDAQILLPIILQNS